MTAVQFPLRYTLCLLTRYERVLLLHRNRPPNQGLWNGVGGHIEAGETPRQACLREIREETGFDVPEITYSGVLIWQGFEIPYGGLYIFHAAAPEGNARSNDEGELAWWNRKDVFTSPQVVSNIHCFGPLVLNGAEPRLYQFEYDDHTILKWQIHALPEALSADQIPPPDGWQMS